MKQRSCSYCGRIHARGYRCPNKPIRQDKVTYIDRFRWTQSWKKKRDAIKQRDKYLCQVCLRELYNTRQQYNMNDLEVHHIEPLREVDGWDKRLDDENLITLCRYHHELAEKGEIGQEELKSFASPPIF